jgi:hypothetical protein
MRSARLSRDTRADLIVRNLELYQSSDESRRVIAFSANVGHARWMAGAFRARGLEAVALTGATAEEEHRDLITRLEDPEDALEILCTVDVLGEGVDIVSISHILLLRPTHSFMVFLQQLGRGLRPAPGKSFVVVLDFVGNYKRSFVAPLALRGHTTVPDRLPRPDQPGAFKLPRSCHVDADAQVRRIWRQELQALDPRQRILEPIRLALEELARTDDHSGPGARDLAEIRLPELFTFTTDGLSGRARADGDGAAVGSAGPLRHAAPTGQDLAKRIRHFGGWLRVRRELDLIGDFEKRLLNTPGETFLRHVEEELKPNKSYKMAVLHTLLDMADRDTAAGDGQGVRVEWPVERPVEGASGEGISPGFLQYYLANRRRTEDWPALARAEDPAHYPLSRVATHLKDMPLDKLSNAESKPFILDRRRNMFSLKEPYHRYWRDPEFRALVRERVEYAEARYWNGRTRG